MSSGSVVVNGQTIHEPEIRHEVAALRHDLETRGIGLSLEQRMELRESAIARLIERVLISQECRRLKLTPSQSEIEENAAAMVPRAAGIAGCRADVDTAEVTRESERRLTADRIIAHWCRHLNPPKSTEVRDYYRRNQEQFRRPESINALHLVRNSEGRNMDGLKEEMEALRERLLAGEDFATLAATCSDCPENGGDLGFFGRGVMVEEFDAVVFAAPLHEITPVFETRFGVHIAVVHERRAEGIAELTEVGGHIAEGLHRTKQDQEVGRRLELLRRKAVVI
jgi:PPIC-type PPIASE domain/SurA N-terminal domain